MTDNPFSPTTHTQLMASLAHCISFMNHAANVLSEEGLGRTAQGVREAAAAADIVLSDAMKELK